MTPRALSALSAVCTLLLAPPPGIAQPPNHQTGQDAQPWGFAYTGGLLGYYRSDVPHNQDKRPTAPDLMRKDLNAAGFNLILGMGDNFAPEMGASIDWTEADKHPEVKPPTGCAPTPPPTRLQDLYKTDAHLPKRAECDNVANFLLNAGYRALVPGREDFIYGAFWLSQLAALLPATRSSDPRDKEPLQLLAANLIVQPTKPPKPRPVPKTIPPTPPPKPPSCPLLFSDPANWNLTTVCDTNPENFAMEKGGYTTTSLASAGDRTLIIAVVDQHLLDPVSTVNQTFCVVLPKSGAAPAPPAPLKYANCEDKNTPSAQMQVKAIDPLQAVVAALHQAPKDIGHIVVMAQMSRGSAEDLAAKLIAARTAHPELPPVNLILSAASTSQFSGNFTLAYNDTSTQTPVLTPHPAYDSGNLNHQPAPLLHPVSTAGEMGQSASGFTLTSTYQSGALPVSARATTLGLLWNEVRKFQPGYREWDDQVDRCRTTPSAPGCPTDPKPLTLTEAAQIKCSLKNTVDPHPDPLDPHLTFAANVQTCDVEGMQYLLQLMRGVRPYPADIAVLERRDFFMGVLPEGYAGYEMCEKLPKDCPLNVALDRVLWKGDVLEWLEVSGTDLQAMLTTSTSESNQQKLLAEPATSGTWLTTFGLVKAPPPPKDNTQAANSAVQTSTEFAVPEDGNCVPVPTSSAPASQYCANGETLRADGPYWLVTSDHLASDTATYTNLSKVSEHLRKYLDDRPGEHKFLTAALTSSIAGITHPAPAPPVAAVLTKGAVPADQAADKGNLAEIAQQEKLHFGIDFARIFFGYLVTNAQGGDPYIAQNFQGVTDTRASAVSQHEFDGEGQLRALWSRALFHSPTGPTGTRFAHHLGFGFQSDAEYDRSAQGNLNGTPSNASYAANNFAVGPLFQYTYPVHHHTPGLMTLARLAVTVSPQFQEQLRGSNLYFGYSQGSSNELVVALANTFSWNVKEGLRLEAGDPQKWYQLSPPTYLEFGPQAAEQHRVLSGITLTHTGPAQQITCSAKSTVTISACVNSYKTSKTLTIDAHTTASTLLYADEPSDGLYWDIHLVKQIPKTNSQLSNLSLTLDSKGDAFLRRGAANVLSTQTLYGITLNPAVNLQITPNLSLSPSGNFFFYQNQLTQQSLVIHGLTVSLRWYYYRDSHVPFYRQLFFKGPATGDLTKQTKMKQGQ